MFFGVVQVKCTGRWLVRTLAGLREGACRMQRWWQQEVRVQNSENGKSRKISKHAHNKLERRADTKVEPPRANPGCAERNTDTCIRTDVGNKKICPR